MKKKYLKTLVLTFALFLLMSYLPGGAIPERVMASSESSTSDTRGKNIIFIGDSRTVGMHQIIGNDGNTWSGEVGMGLNWMMTTGVPQVESKIGPGKRVVILMGFNDVYSVRRADDYNDYINKKAEKWTDAGAEVFYVSVNPITWDSVNNGQITNDKVEKWNELMQDGLSEKVLYIDTYSHVVGKLKAGDGVHFDAPSYHLIYDIILDRIEELEEYEYGRAWSRSDDWKNETVATTGLTTDTEETPAVVSGPSQSDIIDTGEEPGFFAKIGAWLKNWWHSLFGE